MIGLNIYWNSLRQQNLLGPVLQFPASLAVDCSFIYITNWGGRLKFSALRIFVASQWGWIFTWHRSSLLGSHILYECICLISNYIPATSSLWKWGITLNTSLLKWSRQLSKTHTAFFLCCLTSSHSLQLPGIQYSFKLTTSSHGSPHIESFEHFYCLVNVLSNLPEHSPWRRDHVGCY